MKNYILFHKSRHPKECPKKWEASEVSQYLTHLAVNRKVAASTQNQAFSVLLFCYREVLKQPFESLEAVPRIKKPSKRSMVFTKGGGKRLSKLRLG